MIVGIHKHVGQANKNLTDNPDAECTNVIFMFCKSEYYLQVLIALNVTKSSGFEGNVSDRDLQFTLNCVTADGRKRLQFLSYFSSYSRS